MTRDGFTENIIRILAIVVAFLFVFACVTGTVLGVMGGFTFAKGRYLRTHGVAVEGTVVAKQFTYTSQLSVGLSRSPSFLSGLEMSDHYALTIEYAAQDGNRYQTYTTETKWRWATDPQVDSPTHVGAKRALLYDPAHPANAVINDQDALVRKPEAAILIGLLSLIGDVAWLSLLSAFIADSAKRKEPKK